MDLHGDSYSIFQSHKPRRSAMGLCGLRGLECKVKDYRA